MTDSEESYPRLELHYPRPVIAFDIGGTAIKIVVVDARGDVVHTRSVRTPVGEENALLAALVDAVDSTRRDFPQASPAAIGVHITGLVDDDRGVVVLAEHLGLRNVAMRDRLAGLTGLPVAFGNDARGAGVAEFEMGAARGYHNAMVVSIGTGIGAAVFVDGRLYTADGFGAELGHMRTTAVGSTAGVVCACGGWGCLETLSSAKGVEGAYARATGTAPAGAERVFAAAAAGDPVAEAVVDSCIDALALAFAQVTAILSPEIIVVAGGLSGAGEQLLGPLRTRLDSLLTFQRRPVIARARFGGQAGVIASALIAGRLSGSTGNLSTGTRE
ncbi:MAG: ROK family protein [Burkholderiaceae bacterium]|nr:ROK family protein [Microbacteriaceae bacterium]